MSESEIYLLLLSLASKKGDAFYSNSPSTDLIFIKKLNGEFHILEEIISFFRR